MATTQSKFGRRFDEEFKGGVVTLASRPAASDTQGGPRPGRESLQRRVLEEAPRPHSRPASAPGVSVAELERRIRPLERENAVPRPVRLQ